MIFSGNDRDYRGNSGMNRRDNNIRRDDRGPRRTSDDRHSGSEIRRDEKEPRETKREKSFDLPKFVENSGPVSYNLKSTH